MVNAPDAIRILEDLEDSALRKASRSTFASTEREFTREAEALRMAIDALEEKR